MVKEFKAGQVALDPACPDTRDPDESGPALGLSRFIGMYRGFIGDALPTVS